MATPPPSRSVLNLVVHGAYPSSAGGVPFVSVIATMWLFGESAVAWRLVIFPRTPFTLAYSILICLRLSFFFPFLRILVLFLFFLLVVGCMFGTVGCFDRAASIILWISVSV